MGHDNRAVFVRWKDACFYEDMDGKDTPELTGTELDTIGWVIRDDKDGMLIAQEYEKSSGTYRLIVGIPASYIIVKKYLKL